jgi:pimeloyl-ACP methyl ester carboxylesterase
MCKLLRPARWFLMLTLAAFATSPGRAADGKFVTIILTDGFVLQGVVEQNSKSIFDNGQLITWKEGFYAIDDGPRRIIFSPELVNKDPTAISERKREKERQPEPFLSAKSIFYPPSGTMKVSSIRNILELGPWNEKWIRFQRFQTPDPDRPTDLITRNVEQHLSVMTPYYIRVDATKVPWSEYYLTSEFGPEAVTKLLASRPELKGVLRTENKPAPMLAARAIGMMGIPSGQAHVTAAASILCGSARDRDRAEWRFRLCQFYLDAGWLDQAETELDGIAKEFPQFLSEVETARGKVKKERVRKKVDELEDAVAAGQYRKLAKIVENLPDLNLGENYLTKAIERSQALKLAHEKAIEQAKQTRAFLADLPTASPTPPDWLKDAAKLIAEEMPDDLFLKLKEGDPPCRLEAFRTQADEAARKARNSEKPEHSPAELLSYAVTGWLLGNRSAEASVETAEKLWKGRKFLLKYQRTVDPKNRDDLLKGFKKDVNLPVDVMEQLIKMLSPVAAEEKVETTPMELETAAPDKRGKGIQYFLQAPPEYSHGRAFPVLIVLHHYGDKAKDLLGRFQELAARHGYLLVAPQWSGNGLFDGDGGYTYSLEEHAAVLDVLRDVRRRFQVDSDRVFLFGYGQGANMAFDIGLAHPDLFAGVIPMSGAPYYHAEHYWHNAQYLPFYVINGDRAGDSHKQTYGQFRHWIVRNYPVLYVQYKGRGAEWFGGELPNLFEWMMHKKRANPVAQLGTDGLGGPLGNEFQSLRSTDNRFYWLTSDAIDKRHLEEGKEWKGVTAATMTAFIRDNQVTAKTYGLNQLTIWLSRNQVDFDKPVGVLINLKALRNPAKITPSLEVMLEDFLLRGDRQRLNVAKLAFDLK